MDSTHEAATLSVEIRIDLLLKSGLVEVTRANGNTHGNGLLLGSTGHILENGERGVDTTSLTEEGSDGTAGTLGSTEDDINICRNIDLGEVLEDGGETVREVQGLGKQRVRTKPAELSLTGGINYLSLRDLGLNSGPGLRLGSVREEVHDNGTTTDSLVDLEEVLALNPAILNSILPGLAVLANTNDDIEAVVAKVKTLAVALGAVADESEGIVLEVLQQLLLRPIGTLCNQLESVF